MMIMYALTIVLWLSFFLLLFAGLGMFSVAVDVANETRMAIELWMKIIFPVSIVCTVITMAAAGFIKELNGRLKDYQKRISELEKEIERLRKNKR